MTANDLPVCPRCEQDYLRRVRFRGFDEVYQACRECKALWESEEFRSDDDALRWHALTTFENFLCDNDLSYPDDIVWIDLPFGVGQIIRSRDDLEAVGVITGLGNKDGRAYDVELLDERGWTTYSGRMKADSFYLASDVWQRRYRKRRAQASGG